MQLRILRGECGQAAKGIRQRATKRQIESREGVDKCADYFLKNKSRLQYDDALAQGFPVATGVIEGACRHLKILVLICSFLIHLFLVRFSLSHLGVQFH